MVDAVYIVGPTPSDPDRAALGGKGAALAALLEAGFSVPPFVAVPGSVALQGPEVREQAARDTAARLGPGPFAVRSSGIEEDGAEASFAGQYASFLAVPEAALADHIEQVAGSGGAARVAAYRAEQGIESDAPPPVVLVQQMVDAVAAGVAFSVDPVSDFRDEAVVAAVHGLAVPLVDGAETGETVRVGTEGEVVARTPGGQRLALYAAPNGLDERASPSGTPLPDRLAADVAALARRCEAHFGRPQDIEWAWDGETLWLVQSRPITTLKPRGDRERLWDNSNIVESYAGVTTPLTFSFAREAYEGVYRSFCRILKVPERRIRAHDAVFGRMIGLLQGRVYYNLASWYQVLALLPGYTVNARFMERMMGVDEGIPPALKPAPFSESHWRDALALVRSGAGLVAAHLTLGRRQQRFYARLDRTLEPPRGGLENLSYDGLAARYTALQEALLTRWDAPLVNDFFAMIWFGLADRLAARWLGPGLLGPLLVGQGGMVSAEPPRRIRALADQAATDPAWAEALLRGSRADIEAGLKSRPVFAEGVAAYLADFGDRCLEELKLESPTLTDDPTPLFRAIGAFAARGPESERTATDPSESAEARRRERLRGHPLRRLAFGWVLKHARARVRDRENLRFERTRVFGTVRRIVVAMGERLAEASRLDRADDVFYLEIGELIAAAEGTATTRHLAGLAKVRREEFVAYRDAPDPGRRVRTRGAVVTSPLLQCQSPSGTPSDPPQAGEHVRTGLPCCAGTVEGPVRVVRDPRGVELEPGTILVAEQTDPGWILLFPACAGLVVERGSLLSHSAIVARELGIPAVVAVPGLTRWLKDGDRARLDGETSRIERLPSPEAEAAPAAGSGAHSSGTDAS